MKNTGSNNQIRAVVRGILGGVSATAMSAPLFAQTAPAADQTAQGDQLQEVVITGIRASLQRSMEIKQNAIGVVDAISAEDIGQFPDSNIGDAIARIPGVTVNRGNLNYNSAAGAPTSTGATQGINVRGFGGSFNEVLIEGRPIASGNGQTFNFADFSAVYVSEIVVHKTPDMSMSSGAVGGTINITFPNPLDHPGFHAQAFGQGNVYENDGGVRPGFGALVSDTFADNTFGILISGDYLDSHILGHHQDIVGWKGVSQNPNGGYLACSSFAVAPAGSGCTSVGTGATGNSKVPSWYPQDMAMYLERTDSRRKDARVAIQWHPSDNVLITADWNYASDDEHDPRWQRSTWFGAFPGAVQDANGTISSFNYTGPTDFNAFVATNYITTSTPGINVQWDVTDRWSVVADASQSTSKYNPNGGYTDIDADTGYGNGTNNYTGGLTLNQNNKVLPYWSAYGPNVVAGAPGSPAVASPNYNGLNPFIVGSHVLPLQTQQNTDKVTQAKLEGNWKTDATDIKFGLQFTDDLWNTKQSDTFTNNYWQLWSGYGPASNNIVGQALPSSMFTQVSVSPWMPGYSGAGNLPSSLLLYDPYAVLNYLITKPINAGFTPSNGAPPYTGGVPQLALSTGTVQHVDRENYAPFVTARQDMKLGDMKLIANVGLRWQKTNETIAGLSSPLTSLTWQGAGDPTAYAFNTVQPPVWTEVTTSYSYLLPSIDLNLLVTPQVKLSANYSRTEDAPPNLYIIPNTTYTGRVNALTATGNNPNLLPYLSDNFDLGAGWFYGRNSYLSADGFIKKVTNFPTSSVQNVTVPGVTDPAPAINPVTGQPLSNTSGQPARFAETTYTNALSATVHGVEVTWQQELPYGFGFQVNGTYVHSNRNFDPYSLTSNQFALPGVGNSANFIGFYQAHGLQARIAVQWQDKQLLNLGQEQSGGAFGSEPIYLKASTEVDFSTQYNFTDNFAGYFEALNLSDAVYHSYGRFSNQTLNIVDYGRSFTFGIRAKF